MLRLYIRMQHGGAEARVGRKRVKWIQDVYDSNAGVLLDIERWLRLLENVLTRTRRVTIG